MIDKIARSVADACADIKDGSTVLIEDLDALHRDRLVVGLLDFVAVHRVVQRCIGHARSRSCQAGRDAAVDQRTHGKRLGARAEADR